MEKNQRRDGETSSTEMGIYIRRLQIIGEELLAQTYQERLFTLVQINKPGVEGYESNRKS